MLVKCINHHNKWQYKTHILYEHKKPILEVGNQKTLAQTHSHLYMIPKKGL